MSRGEEPPRGGYPALPGEAADASLEASSVLIARGALAAEEALLARVDALMAESRRDPARLALPLRVVVPSRSLRRHVAAQLVRPRRRDTDWVGGFRRPPGALAGVVVQTLYGVACEALERSGERVPRGAVLFETLVEREARREPLLRRGLGDLVDGFLTLAATVADLLDAGLEPEHLEALDEAVASDGPRVASRDEVERVRAMLRVAARSELRLRHLGLGGRSSLLRRAGEALARDPDRALPCRAVLLHGFVAPNGVAADLLLTLLRRPAALLILDRPPVPGFTAGSEAAATARLAERAAALAHTYAWAPPAADAVDPPGDASHRDEGAAHHAAGASFAAGPEPAPAAAFAVEPAARVAEPHLEAFFALGIDAEAREVARRLRRLLDGRAVEGEPEPASPAAGTVVLPEGIAVVARDLVPYRAALRRHLGRLAVPFSGVGASGGLLPAGRSAAAVLDLLRWGADTPVDRWLDAADNLRASLRVDLRLALRALGAGRLREAAALRDQSFEGGFALPIRQGIAPAGPSRTAAAVDVEVEAEAAEEGDGRAVARARRISERRLRQGLQAAARVHDGLAAWPRQAAMAVHLERLHGLLRELGLDRDPAQPLLAALEELADQTPAEMMLAAEELRLLVARALGAGGQGAVGGSGGGVQVLTLAEARGRTFDRLFLLGLNRHVFPRTAREDPLLPDGLRQILQRMLPDLALRRDALDDERHAFAQLLSAAPRICLSWLTADDDGRPLSPSPYVERLVPALPPLPLQTAAHAVYSPLEAAADRQARPADELAVLASLHGSRDDLALALPAALREMGEQWGRPALGLDARSVGEARRRVLDELDPDLRTAAGRAAAARLGPYFGFVGPLPGRAGHRLYVTHLEALAACPWQLFLGRLLRVERPPDPLGTLPGADPLRLGNLVHRVLERIVEQALAAAGAARPSAVAWPPAGEVETLLIAAAGEILEEDGLVLPGLARALATHAAPFLDAAREVDWPRPDSTVDVMASEVDGELDVEDAGGLAWKVRFRADREDLDAAGARRFTDYKTGRPLTESGKDDAARRRLLTEIRSGQRLQAVAYVLAATAPGVVNSVTAQPSSPAMSASAAVDLATAANAANEANPGGAAVAAAAAAGRPAGTGRYLFLRPGLAAARREVAVDGDDGEARSAFTAAMRGALGAWDAGSFFPRLVDAAGRQEPPRCARCTLAEACLRGDSSARRRLAEWTRRARRGGPLADRAEAALLAAWDLAAASDTASAAEIPGAVDTADGPEPAAAAGTAEEPGT